MADEVVAPGIDSVWAIKIIDGKNYAPGAGLLAGSFRTVRVFCGNVAPVQLPNVACRAVQIQAWIQNVGIVSVLGTDGAGDPDDDPGEELRAGNKTEWIEVDNLNRIHVEGTDSLDEVRVKYLV